MSNISSAGVIIARFQVPELHAGHRHLIEYVASRHTRVIVLLGDRAIQANDRHPLDFETRKLMLRGVYPTVEVVQLFDKGDDDAWSRTVDDVLRHFAADDGILYGSRDSFIPHYTGSHECREVPRLGDHNGTALRENGCEPVDSVDFRRGMIYRAKRRYPQGHPTVDVAILRNGGREVLLGKRSATDVWWRFPGGFFDPTKDNSLEHAAAREGKEETGVKVKPKQAIYLGSTKVDDWRYADSKDRIVTTLYAFNDPGSTPKAADDLGIVEWQHVSSLSGRLWKGHRPLLALLRKYLAQHS